MRTYKRLRANVDAAGEYETADLVFIRDGADLYRLGIFSEWDGDYEWFTGQTWADIERLLNDGDL